MSPVARRVVVDPGGRTLVVLVAGSVVTVSEGAVEVVALALVVDVDVATAVLVDLEAPDRADERVIARCPPISVVVVEFEGIGERGPESARLTPNPNVTISPSAPARTLTRVEFRRSRFPPLL